MQSRSEVGETDVVPRLFDRQVAKTPDAVAVVHDGAALTYRELAKRSDRLASILRQRGAGPDMLVAVMLDRSAELLVAVLGVLKAGAGYVPLASDDPPRRIAHILRDSAASLVITSPQTRSELVRSASGTAAVLGLSGDHVGALAGATVMNAPAAPRRPIDGGDIAYVIYTSGSTGGPKGVVIEHRALARYLCFARAAYPAMAGRVLLHSSVSFDMAVTSLFGPLVTGGSIIVVDLMGLATGAPMPPGFGQPTFLKVTPSHLALLGTLPRTCWPTEQIVVGGEALLGEALERWRRANPSVTVTNEYGPTEATVGCCVHHIRPGDDVDAGAVPIGMAIDGTRLYVLDGARRPVQDGETGELYIGGDQLARGYLNRPELDAERFLSDPFGPAGSRMFRTGDLVRRRGDAGLEYLGRVDDQTKINGYLVLPGEVEAAITRFGVPQALVVARSMRGGSKQLVAYLASAPDKTVDLDALRCHLAADLPDYMVPSAFVVVPAFTLTANGKIDRTMLPEPSSVAAPDEPDAAPVQTSEAALCRLVQELVGVSQVGIDDDFLALGGTSIAAARLVTRARAAGLDLRLADVLRKRTVRRMLTR